MSEYDWLKARECAGKSSRIFYPLPSEKGLETLAKAICKRCPVRGACLHEALVHDEFGIWGGTNERERVTIRALLGPDVTAAIQQIA